MINKNRLKSRFLMKGYYATISLVVVYRRAITKMRFVC